MIKDLGLGPVLIGLTLGVTAMMAKPVAAQSAQEISIGIGGPLTTTSAGFGIEMRQAVDLAIDEANASDGLLGAKLATGLSNVVLERIFGVALLLIALKMILAK